MRLFQESVSPSMLLSGFRDRIAPAEAGETREIPVAGAEFSLILDGEGGEIGVGGQVSGGPQLAERLEKNVTKAIAWFQNYNARLSKPRLDMTGGALDGHRDG